MRAGERLTQTQCHMAPSDTGHTRMHTHRHTNTTHRCTHTHMLRHTKTCTKSHPGKPTHKLLTSIEAHGHSHHQAGSLANTKTIWRHTCQSHGTQTLTCRQAPTKSPGLRTATGMCTMSVLPQDWTVPLPAAWGFVAAPAWVGCSL